MLNIFNWITIQSIILHSVLSNYGSVYICENSNKLDRVTPQSKVVSKMAPYRTAVMIVTAILDLEARRKAKEASKAGTRKIRPVRQFSRTLHRPFLGLFCPIRVSYLHGFNSSCTASSLHKAIKSFLKPPRVRHFVQSHTVTTSNNPLGVVWSNCNPIIIRDCN